MGISLRGTSLTFSMHLGNLCILHKQQKKETTKTTLPQNTSPQNKASSAPSLPELVAHVQLYRIPSKPSGHQEYYHIAFLLARLVFFYGLMLCSDSKTLQHLINMD